MAIKVLKTKSIIEQTGVSKGGWVNQRNTGHFMAELEIYGENRGWFIVSPVGNKFDDDSSLDAKVKGV